MNRLAIIFILFLFFIHLLACNKQSANEKLLLGNWQGIMPHTEQFAAGFAFNADNTFENKQGYYKSNGKGLPTNLGNFSQYKFQHDSLLIFDPATSKWNYHQVFKITPDSLVMTWNNDTLSLMRYQEKDEALPDFDKIVVNFESDGVYKDIYSNIDVELNKDRTIVYRYNLNENGVGTGLFTGIVPQQQYSQFIDNFKHAGITNLKESYYPENKIEEDHATVTFVKSGKIIKSITDKGYFAPFTFFWAYKPFINLHQNIKLNHVSLEGITSLLQYTSYSKLERGNKRYKDALFINTSDTFLLFSYIAQGKICNKQFETRFQLTPTQHHTKKEFTIDTDGRYYKFMVNDKPVTVDIGFNFYDLNLAKREWDIFIQ
jgi:hypothetical protein